MEKIIEPLQIKMTDKKGETEFYLYIKGDDPQIKKIITFLQNYLKLSKEHKKGAEKTSKEKVE